MNAIIKFFTANPDQTAEEERNERLEGLWIFIFTILAMLAFCIAVGN